MLGSGWKVAGQVAGSRAEATWVLDRMIRTALLYELGAALVTVLLFGCAGRFCARRCDWGSGGGGRHDHRAERDSSVWVRVRQHRHRGSAGGDLPTLYEECACTSAIDAEAGQQIFAELRRAGATRITLVVSHRAWTLRAMDRIYVIDNGTVIQEDTFDELMARPGGRFARLFAAQHE